MDPEGYNCRRLLANGGGEKNQAAAVFGATFLRDHPGARRDHHDSLLKREEFGTNERPPDCPVG